MRNNMKTKTIKKDITITFCKEYCSWSLCDFNSMKPTYEEINAVQNV